MRICFASIGLSLLCMAASAQIGSSPIPAFKATALDGKAVTAERLIGQPTILIVTPSRDAAKDTRMWANALRRNIDHKAYRIRDVLAIDLPFFMSEADAIGRAREKIPKRYHDQTWLLAEPDLEKALGIPVDSHQAFVIVLNAKGDIVARAEGEPTEAKMGELQSALQSLLR